MVYGGHPQCYIGIQTFQIKRAAKPRFCVKSFLYSTGHRVILLASTSASEKKLKKDFPEAVTLQKFERDTGLRDSARGSVDQGFSVCCGLATADFATAN